MTSGRSEPVSATSTPTPLVSVCMPVYNGENHLREALDSILAQTFTDFELIVSDNASTDSTLQMIRDYAARDRRIRVFSQPRNIGVANNHAFAARQAQGAYVKWVSGNDVYAETLLARLVDVLQLRRDVVLCYGGTQFIDESGRRLQVHTGDFEAPMEDPIARYDVARSRFALGTPLQCGLVRREALQRCHYLGNYAHSDRTLTAALALYGKIILLPEVLFFRRWGQTISTPLRSPMELQRLYKPQAKREPIFVDLRLHAGHLAALARAPIPLFDKARGLVQCMRYANWERRYLFAEFGVLLRRVYAALLKRA